MIQCPKCGGLRVHEERNVLLSAWEDALFSPWSAVLSVILSLLLFWFLWSLLPEGYRELVGENCGACVAFVILVSFPLVISRAISLVISIPFVRSRFRLADRWPREYRRFCRLCGHRWTRINGIRWKPGESQPEVQIRPDLVQRRELKPVTRAASEDKHLRSSRQRMQVRAYRPFLDELLSHWNATYIPDTAFSLETPESAVALFKDYQQALGEDLSMSPGYHATGYFRNYYPQRGEVLSFIGAYLHLRRGDRAKGARRLRALTRSSPRFADPWIWMTAVTDNPSARQAYLERAVQLEPAHPLAVDALAIARGEVSPVVARRGRTEVIIARCPQCGGSLRYEPDATEVACPYCGHQLRLQETDLIDAHAPLVSSLRLQRLYQGHTWAEVERIVRCQACGAELIMTHHLARRCAYCGSTNVLVEDNQRPFEQPDGFLPFELDKRQIADAVRKGKKRTSGGWQTSARRFDLQGLQPIYVPFWVFDGVVEAKMLTKKKTTVTSSGSYRQIQYDNMLFSEVDIPPPSFLDQALPFDLSALVPYEPRLLADWPAQLYNLDVEVVVEDAYEAMIALARRQDDPLKGTVMMIIRLLLSRFSTTTTRSLQVSSTTYQLVLLPVWVVLLRQEDKRSLALVNGQTGKVVTGLTLPSDKADSI